MSEISDIAKEMAQSLFKAGAMDKSTLDEVEALCHAQEQEDVLQVGVRKRLQLGPEARRHLLAGRPITFSDDDYPGEIVRLYPDGRREIVAFDRDYNEVVVRKLPDETRLQEALAPKEPWFPSRMRTHG